MNRTQGYNADKSPLKSVQMTTTRAPADPTPRREATRQRLIDAAVREFAARGIDATSVERLCESAGFTRGAFYSNFSTKDDLCIAVLEWHRDQLLQRISETFSTSGEAIPDGGATLEWALSEALPAFFGSPETENDNLVTLIEIRLRATRSPELRKRLADFENATRPMMIQVLANLSETLDVELAVKPTELLDLCQAVYFGIALSTDVSEQLLATTVQALIRKD